MSFVSSEDQAEINSADIFLLLLNHTSRPLRKEFELQKRRSTTMAHRYQWKCHGHPNSPQTSTDNNTIDSSTSQNESENIYQSELVFLKTANRVIAPFTLITIPLVNHLSALILIEVNIDSREKRFTACIDIFQWEISMECSILFYLVRQLDIYTSHGLFPFNKLNSQVKAIESSPIIRQYVREKSFDISFDDMSSFLQFENHAFSANGLSGLLNAAHESHQSVEYTIGDINQKQRMYSFI